MEEQNVPDLIERLKSWSQMSEDDMTAHMFYQKAEQTLESVNSFFQEYNKKEVDAEAYHLAFQWSVQIRDFSIFLRDTLLSLVKYEQYHKDDRLQDSEFITSLTNTIKSAASSIVSSYDQKKLSDIEINSYKHQANPVSGVLGQVDVLNIQLKKIYRSSDKVNEIRLNLDVFKRDFHLNFQKQTGVVDSLVEQVASVAAIVSGIHPSGTKIEISKAIDGINSAYSNLESLQTVESMEVLTYTNKVNLNIPVNSGTGQLETKSVDIQTEISKWFSGNIYPHIIELENRRNLALEASLTSLNHARVKLAALILDDKETYDTSASDVKLGITELRNQYILPLKKEAEENSSVIDQYLEKDFYASSIYNDDALFMPNNGSIQMTNISRDAQKRMVSSYRKYKKSTYNWFKNSLAKYIELERIPHNQYISNKLLINKNDERLSLFLKSGYLGKSFTVPRPKLMRPIIADYELWKNGFAASILIYGQSGTGKSALIGMLAQSVITDELINVNAGEPYFTKNKSFDRSYSLKEVVTNVAHQYLGRKVILTIDDLGQWHSSENNLYDNIDVLFELIQRYKGDIFFIVSCNSYLRSRINIFRDLDLLFSSQIRVGELDNDAIKEALMMRYRALPELGLTDTAHENTISPILRNANGNIGHAMLEYSRFFNSEYIPDLKSQEFIELVNQHGTILKYILSYQNIDKQEMSQLLTETEYLDFKTHIDYLIGLKILIYSRANIISVNPFLIYSVERALAYKKTA